MNCAKCHSTVVGTAVIDCDGDSPIRVFCAACASSLSDRQVPYDIRWARGHLRDFKRALRKDDFYRTMTPPEGVKAVR